MKKRILFLTGTRADFGKLKPLIEESEKYETFETHIFATGMHTLSRYGSTHLEIRKCGFRNLFLHINQMASTGGAMDQVLARTIDGLSHYCHEFRPDLIVLHGDRVEAMAGAIVGALNNILVAHIEGGELSGTVDGLIRHAVSKLAHLHFVANADAQRRLIQMGEVESTVFVIGSPDVDLMLSERLPSLHEAQRHYGIAFENYGIFLYHPVTTELEQLRENTRSVVRAVLQSGLDFVALYPNNDTGADVILDEMAPLRAHPRVRMFPSIRFEHFLTLLRHSKVIVGNSSAGIREAPVYGVPTINIGTRQSNRFNYPSIINVPDHEDAVLKALANLPPVTVPSRHFGDPGSAGRFIEVLKRSDFWDTPCQKQFQDQPAARSTNDTYSRSLRS